MNNLIQKKQIKINIPTNYFCNQKCIFCNEGDKSDYQYLKGKEDVYVYNLIKKGIKQSNSIVFTTGEPTLNKNLKNYIYFAKKIGYLDIGIITNGTRLNNINYLSSLINSGLTDITFSIHGSNHIIHDYNTGIKGTFNLALKSFLLTKKFFPKIKICLSFVMNRTNFFDLYNYILKFSRLGVDVIIVNTMRPEGRGLENLSKLSIRYDDFKKYILSLKKEERDYINHCINTDKLNIMDIPPCILIESSILIKGYGKLEKRVVENGNIIDNFDDKIYLEKCKDCSFLLEGCEGFYYNNIS